MRESSKQGFIKFLVEELKPKGKIITPFNVISAVIILTAAVILVFRFANGLGSVAEASQERPWGLWINFNVITGVAFAGGAYVVTFMVYIIGLEKYRPIVRPTVLYGLLAYVFYAGALLLDLGRPWKVINPIIGNSFGLSSVLFLVAWHFILYMIAEFLEFLPAVSEWAGWKKLRKTVSRLTLGAVIFGIALSTLHQSGLGALFLMAKPKIHPLWYSEFIPILFFVSSIFAGLSLVIVAESISQKSFKKIMSALHINTHKNIVLSLSRICSVAMFVYLFLQVLVFIHGKNLSYLNTPYGYWYLLEMIGFVALPCFLFMYAYRNSNVRLVRIAAVVTMIGIILNRMNISTIAYQWYSDSLHFPSWMEIVVSVAVILMQILVFRWIARRMPVFSESPSWVSQGKTRHIDDVTKKEKSWKALAQ